MTPPVGCPVYFAAGKSLSQPSTISGRTLSDLAISPVACPRAWSFLAIVIASRRSTDDILAHLEPGRYRLLPNTSGVRDAREAVLAAELAREAL